MLRTASVAASVIKRRCAALLAATCCANLRCCEDVRGSQRLRRSRRLRKPTFGSTAAHPSHRLDRPPRPGAAHARLVELADGPALPAAAVELLGLWSRLVPLSALKRGAIYVFREHTKPTWESWPDGGKWGVLRPDAPAAVGRCGRAALALVGEQLWLGERPARVAPSPARPGGGASAVDVRRGRARCGDARRAIARAAAAAAAGLRRARLLAARRRDAAPRSRSRWHGAVVAVPSESAGVES